MEQLNLAQSQTEEHKVIISENNYENDVKIEDENNIIG